MWLGSDDKPLALPPTPPYTKITRGHYRAHIAFEKNRECSSQCAVWPFHSFPPHVMGWVESNEIKNGLKTVARAALYKLTSNLIKGKIQCKADTPVVSCCFIRWGFSTPWISQFLQLTSRCWILCWNMSSRVHLYFSRNAFGIILHPYNGFKSCRFGINWLVSDL